MYIDIQLTQVEKMQIKVFRGFTKEGCKILFAEEKQKYTVRAFDGRYAVCTKPMNAQKTVLYTIVDFEEGIRGTENLVFCMGFETGELCKEALLRLQSGESEVSHRNRIKLNISNVEKP